MTTDNAEGTSQGTEKPQWPPPGTEGFLVKRVVLFDGQGPVECFDPAPQDSGPQRKLMVTADRLVTYENVLLYAAANLVDIITPDRLLSVPASRIWEFEVGKDHRMYQHRMQQLPKSFKGWEKANARPDVDEEVYDDPALR